MVSRKELIYMVEKFDSIIDDAWLLLNESETIDYVPQEVLYAAVNKFALRLLYTLGMSSEELMSSKHYDDLIALKVEVGSAEN